MDTILAGRNGIRTARKLAELVGITCYRCSSYNIGCGDPVNVVIRWGSSAPATCLDNQIIEYNPRAGILLASHKRLALETMTASGVPTPALTTTRFPCVGRTNYHRAGRGFWLCNSEEEVTKARSEGATYFMEFYPKQREYRVHVAHGKVLVVQEKVPRDGQEEKRKEPIWNHATNDFIFQTIRQNLWPLNVVRTAIGAVNSLGLDFGGVDVMSTPEYGDFPPCVICEVNTAPTLEDYLLAKYASYFEWLLESEERIPHFEVVSNMKKDFVWREGV